MATAVVAGTSTGIGLATGLALARHGYRVFARDAIGVATSRRRISDEEFAALGGDRSDGQYSGRVAHRFGIELR